MEHQGTDKERVNKLEVERHKRKARQASHDWFKQTTELEGGRSTQSLAALSEKQRAEALLSLQRTYGNRYVQAMIARELAGDSALVGVAPGAKGEITAEGGIEIEPLVSLSEDGGGGTAAATAAAPAPATAPAPAAPTPYPTAPVSFQLTTTSLGPGMTTPCTTRPGNMSITGEAVLVADQYWRYHVTGVTSPGQINIVPTPAENTPNPVDGGNVHQSDTTFRNDWRFINDDMADYTATGAKGPEWHVTEASEVHEMYHWEHDWQQVSLAPFWAATQAAMEAVTIPANAATDAATALTQLTPGVQSAFTTGWNKMVNAWNATPDGPGDPPYQTGQVVLDQMIAEVQAYADTKNMELGEETCW